MTLPARRQIPDVNGINTADVHITTTRHPITDLDGLPFPDRSLVDYEKYHQYIGQTSFKHSITMLGSRGCPFNCVYCHKIWPNRQVIRSAENIFAELQLFYHMGVRRFAFLDDVFNLNIRNSTRFLKLIKANELKVQLLLCVRGDILTKDYIDLMVEAGTVRIAAALETASPRVQRLIKKNLHVEKLRENLEYICQQYPHVILELNTMHGFPTESEDEAMMTLNFIKSIKWIHFPYVNILRIYPNTEMEKLALENGISRHAIEESTSLAYHELPATLPFNKSFTFKYQSDFLHRYFLQKQRLLHVLPYQMRILTEDEILQKYNSYLPAEIRTFNDLLRLSGITREELSKKKFVSKESSVVPDLNEKIKAVFPAQAPGKNALKILLIDLSQLFTGTRQILYDVVEPPLGLMALMSYLYRHLGSKVNGKIIKSRIDFDHYDQLKELLYKFNPDIIGLRTLTFFKEFFHETASFIRKWGIAVPIIAGGPYATSDYKEVLGDRNIDLVVLGEGEITFCQLIRAFLENDRKLPPEVILKEIPGICFMPGNTGNIEQNNIHYQENINKVPIPDLFSHFNEDLENE